MRTYYRVLAMLSMSVSVLAGVTAKADEDVVRTVSGVMCQKTGNIFGGGKFVCPIPSDFYLPARNIDRAYADIVLPQDSRLPAVHLTTKICRQSYQGFTQCTADQVDDVAGAMPLPNDTGVLPGFFETTVSDGFMVFDQSNWQVWDYFWLEIAWSKTNLQIPDPKMLGIGLRYR